jgi:Fe-S cluster assembly protein SufD
MDPRRPIEAMTDNNVNGNVFVESYAQFEKSESFKQHSWLRQARGEAMARFVEAGFPTTRQEEWRHTNLAPLTKVPFRTAPHGHDAVAASDLGRFIFNEEECCRLVFVNGRFSAELSATKCLPRGACIRSLASALETDRPLIEPFLAADASRRRNVFASLNTAFLSDGAFVHLPSGAALKHVLHLVFLSSASPDPLVSHPRTLIVVGDGCEASIVESYAGLDHGVYFTNAVTEIVLGAGASVDHYKLQRESEGSFHIGTMEVAQGRGSRFSSHSISLGGGLVRNDVNVAMNAEGGECTLNGLYLTQNRQHVDNHTSIDHARPHCDSRELYKGILDDKSTGVFNGRILVRKDAQKTNAKQANKNLLLSEEALVNTTPQLEIFADDVKCTHGATIGHLDEEELFYTRSRGIGAQAARTLLTYAFASDILSSVKYKPIQCQIDLVLLARLSRGRN